DQEIADLRARVTTHDEADAATAAADSVRLSEHDAGLKAAIDQDEIIRQERERLGTLELEWKEKLRQAEIELSVHRAKISRERLEMEEQLRTLEEQKAELKALQESGETAGEGKPRKPTRRWLERLGLK